MTLFELLLPLRLNFSLIRLDSGQSLFIFLFNFQLSSFLIIDDLFGLTLLDGFKVGKLLLFLFLFLKLDGELTSK